VKDVVFRADKPSTLTEIRSDSITAPLTPASPWLQGAFVACFHGLTCIQARLESMSILLCCGMDGNDGIMSANGRDWPNWLPHPLWIRRECPRCNSVKFKEAELRR